MLPPAFQVIVLGSGGGPGSDDLSSYLIAPIGSQEYISVDAGTLLPGIVAALKKGFLQANPSSLAPEIEILQNQIKAYLISHAHLDHLAGLVIDSQADIPKPILGIASTIDYIRDHIFNTAIWPNFGNEGKDSINQYSYIRLPPFEKKPIPNTSMTVEAFPLNHPTGYLSSAFLLESKGEYLAYIGNSSPDALEQKKYLQAAWQRLAPLVNEGRLHGIFIECSYPDSRPDEKLYGHLKPSYLIQELENFASIVSNKENLKNVKILVVHIKTTLYAGTPNKEQIQQELRKLNRLNFELTFPEQGDKLEL